MKNLIKAIRSSADMSQERFASALGTTPLSINRWENGKARPNKMAQTQIYNFCKERDIDAAALIQNIKADGNNDNRLILYHGSAKGIIGDIAPISRKECDFGRGFYMSENTVDALTLVCNEERPKLYTLELDMSGLRVLTVDKGIDWALLIAYYRKEIEDAKGGGVYEKYAQMAEGYDLIVGYAANESIYTQLSRFFNKTLTDSALINCLNALKPARQFAAVSEKACRQIKIIKEEELTQLELLLLTDIGVRRRKAGIALAEEIELKYRREGRFLDEILRGE